MFLFAVTPIFNKYYLYYCCTRDRSPEVDDVEDLAAAATKHLDLLKQKNEINIMFKMIYICFYYKK